MKKYTLRVWLIGQHPDDSPWLYDTVLADSPDEALRNVTGALRTPNAVITLHNDRNGAQQVVSGSKILWAEAIKQVSAS